jgi:dipeptidyl aminopeptidase/acylaminoacyl peptidase
MAPDGRHIAYVSADEPTDDENARKKRRDDAVVWGERLAHGRLRLLNAATGEVRTLFSKGEHVAEFCWSPDGSAIALITWPTPNTEGREWYVRLHLVDVATGDIRHRHTFAGSAGNLVWSPTGTALYFCAGADGKPQDSAVVWRIGLDTGNPEHVACMGAGVSDWGMLLTNDLPVFEQALGGDAPRDGLEAQRHRRTSPITYARNARTPLLILHGEDDERVPVNQAVAFHRALRANGTPATFVRYPREPHAIGERAHQIDLLNRVRAWCTDHLLNG